MKKSRSSFPLVLDPLQAKAVARRTKTQLRRRATTVSLAGGDRVTRSCGLHVSDTYEVARSDTGVVLARVVVTDVHLQRLGDVDVEAAAAEGHQSVASFADWWLRRHDRTWPPQEEKICGNCAGHAEYTDHDGQVVACTVCELGVVMGDEETTGLQVLERFAHHAERRVWVASFMLDDRVFLHRHSQRGYTNNPADALQGEPEVIGEPLPVWKARAEARRREDLRDVDAVRLSGRPSIDDQLDELRRMAAERGVDLTRERHVIEQRAKAIEDKTRRAA